MLIVVTTTAWGELPGARVVAESHNGCWKTVDLLVDASREATDELLHRQALRELPAVAVRFPTPGSVFEVVAWDRDRSGRFFRRLTRRLRITDDDRWEEAPLPAELAGREWHWRQR